MRTEALEYLACPDCDAGLELARVERRDAEHVLAGTLACVGCGAEHRVRAGVPRLVARAVRVDVRATAARFDAAWAAFGGLPAEAGSVRQWLDPVGPADLRGRRVLEAGCGVGHHTSEVAGWGPRALVALELGDSVDAAFARTRGLPAVHVVQGDLLHAPVRRCFEVGFSIGVLHHLPEPALGFAALRSRVAPGGTVAVWVYGREGNRWLLRVLDPLRRGVGARVPTAVLRWLSLAPALAVAAAARVYAGHPYLRRARALPLVELHKIVFDQLVPPVAHYLEAGEVRAWLARAGVEAVELRAHNRNSWSARGVVSA